MINKKNQYYSQLMDIGKQELNINSEEAKQALDKLIKLGLVKITKNGVVLR